MKKLSPVVLAVCCLGGCSHGPAGTGSDVATDASGSGRGSGTSRESATSSGASRDSVGSSSSRSGSGDGSGSIGKDSGGPVDSGALADSGSSSDSSTVVSSAFYVAPNGNDMNQGTLAAPFATLAQAQKAMQASANVKTTYVRAGTYAPPVTGSTCVWGNAAGSALTLTSADDGETWSYYPPDGYGSAILDGQSTTGASGADGGNGAGCGFGMSGVSNVTIVGLGFQNYLYAAIWGATSAGVVIRDNVIHDILGAAWGAGAVYLVASPGALVENNYVHDVAYNGLEIEDNSTGGNAIGDTIVASNVVLNACGWRSASGGGDDQNGGDCGAIYFWSQTPSTSTGMSIRDNYIRDVNTSSSGAGDFGHCCAMGIYLDDGMNNVTMSGNVITGITSSCFMIHGGQDNVIQGNLCDVGASGTEAIIEYQNDGDTPMTGNIFEHNVVVASGSGVGGGFAGVGAPPNPMTIQDNAYFNYAASTVDTTGTGGAGSDSAPTYVDPQVSCWAPSVASGSAVFAAPVSFPGIHGGWGPPGLSIPMTGTAPSWPHGC